MTSLLAVDPGLRHCGAALFQAGKLHSAALVKNPVTSGDGADACWRMAQAVCHWAAAPGVGFPEVVICERMQVYGPDKSKGDPNDLITLSIIAGMLRPTWLYLPREWKGQVPKPARKSDPYILEARVRARLEPAELARLPENVGPAWDVIDAVGIGLHHLGRLTPRRLFPR